MNELIAWIGTPIGLTVIGVLIAFKIRKDRDAEIEAEKEAERKKRLRKKRDNTVTVTEIKITKIKNSKENSFEET